MSTLSRAEQRVLERFFRMGHGYVLGFSDRTFDDFVSEVVDRDIHGGLYSEAGTSKANKLRTFWRIESDPVSARLILALVEHEESENPPSDEKSRALVESCKRIANRLLAGAPSLMPLKEHARNLDAAYLTEQIRRMEAAVESDPSLAIGTAKELIETCCRTILAERGVPIPGTPDVPLLTKATLKELRLVPEGIPDAARGADVIKRLLSNLGTIGNGLAELRGLYGTGHGKEGNAKGLGERHARLAVGAASTLAVFLFATHEETR